MFIVYLVYSIASPYQRPYLYTRYIFVYYIYSYTILLDISYTIIDFEPKETNRCPFSRHP